MKHFRRELGKWQDFKLRLLLGRNTEKYHCCKIKSQKITVVKYKATDNTATAYRNLKSC